MTDAAPPSDSDESAASDQVDSVLSYTLVWLALVVLLGATLLADRLLDGSLNAGVGLLIAAVKAALVAWFFLHLRHHSGLTRVAAGFALLWLLLLVTFVLADYLTRTPGPAGALLFTTP